MAHEVLLTTVEQLFMTAVLLRDNNAYGSQIFDQATDLAKPTRVAYGSLYPTLERLERKGFLTSCFGQPIPERGGKSRRYFQVTAAGEQALKTSGNLSQKIYAGLRNAWGTS